MKYFFGGIVAIVIIAGAIFFFTRNPASAPEIKTITIATTTESSPARRTPPVGFKEYENTLYRFSLFYPEEMKVGEKKERGAAMTITFEDTEAVRGFQIFVFPYPEETVSEERFRTDIPSGVREDLKDITVDGAVGASFHSTDINLGETSEVWFVKAPFLYEVTTLREIESDLEPVIQSWQFI